MSLLCTVVLLALFSAPSDALTNDEISEFTARIHTESNTNLQGTVNVDTSSDAENIIITSNGIPDHETGTFPGPDNRNNIKSQKFSFRYASKFTIHQPYIRYKKEGARDGERE